MRNSEEEERERAGVKKGNLQLDFCGETTIVEVCSGGEKQSIDGGEFVLRRHLKLAGQNHSSL